MKISKGTTSAAVFLLLMVAGCKSQQELDTQLQVAVTKNKTHQALSLISSGANVNFKRVLDTSLLFYPLTKGNDKLAVELIKANIDIAELFEKNRTPLHLAAIKGMNKTIIELLKKRVNINAKNVWGQTPLDEAINYKRNKTVRLLLNKKANPFSYDNFGLNAFTRSFRFRNLEVLDLLKQYSKELMALNNAVSSNDIKKLQKVKMDLKIIDLDQKDSKGRTAIINSIIRNKEKTMLWLLQKKVNLLSKDNYGFTALNYAKVSINKNFFKYLKNPQKTSTDLLNNEKRRIQEKASKLEKRKVFEKKNKLKKQKNQPKKSKTPINLVATSSQKTKKETEKTYFIKIMKIVDKALKVSKRNNLKE